MRRSLSLQELVVARSVLGRAYTNDPLMRWIFPQPRDRADCVAAYLGIQLERYADNGSVHLIGDPAVGVCVYEPWPADGNVDPEVLPTVDGLLGALIGPMRAQEVHASLRQLEALGPSEECIYLRDLAVEPGHQGTGHGSQLLEMCLISAKRRRLPVKLDTTNPVNVDFYRRQGFAVVGEMSLGSDGPMAWSMWRPVGYY